jgi:hypothetical protein
MATRILGPAGGKRRRRLLLLLPLAAIAALVLGLTGALATVSSDSGFEGSDGNLIVNTAGNTDWNSFTAVVYNQGTAPYQQGDTTANGWAFTGVTDAQAVTSDTAFAGGTKQDNNCATVGTGKASNKDDLKRIYVAHKSVNGKVYLALGWVRIPQNTTSPSAHVAFEFNQGTTPCPAGSDGLVQRTAGDLLFVYDFEGGSTDVPTITVRRWVTSGACEVGSSTAPCWGTAQNLTAFGFADAKVNTFGSVLDQAGPTDETLGTNEFGETVINATDAGLFPSNVCTSFGQVEGVSRSSGNSGTAQMKDLVGPGHVTISNCGTLKVKKVTNPNPDPTDPDALFPFTVSGGGTSNSSILPKTFSLSNQQTNSTTVFPASNFSVAEGTLPTGWQFTTASCDNGSGSLSGKTLSSVSVAIDTTTTCTFTNTLQQGAIKISKTSSKTGNALAGATFSITGPGGYSNSVTTGLDGSVCVDGLSFGDYTVTETGAPTGFIIDDSTGHTVTVDTNATCSDNPYVGETDSFTDTPTSDIQVNFRDGGSGETSGSISCDNTTGTGSDTITSGWDTSRTVTGISAPTTVTCTITIDP